MQHRYTADIGDYAKYGLLRALSNGVSLGVAWYLYPDEGHNSDGKHIAYLEQPEKWQHLDQDLFDKLNEIVRSDNRDLHAIEHSNIFPDATFSNTILEFAGTPNDRRDQRNKWFHDVERQLSNCDLVFTDPDNGLCEDEKYRWGQMKYWKRLPLSEAFSLTNGRPGVLYHHNAMYKGGHAKEIQFWLSRLGHDALALYWRPYSPRTFFIVNPTDEIRARAEAFAHRWDPHFQLHTYQGTAPTKGHVVPLTVQQSTVNNPGLKSCPECGHQFTGTGWGGIDAHWKSKHEHIMPYKDAWPLIRSENWK